MKKKMLVVLGMTVFLLSGCMGKEEIVQTEQLEVSEVTEVQEIVVVENPNNLPVLTGNETEEGLYWDTEWQHETYVEFGPGGDVYFDKYGNTYSCPVDGEGNLLVE